MQSMMIEASTEEPLLSARETAQRLGVKLDTLYAYVSRGRLPSVAVPGSRERRYRVGDVERFRAGRRGERVRDALMPVLDSASCLIEDGRFYYRSHDAIDLAETATLEDVAALLWGEETARLQTAPHPGPLPINGERERCGERLSCVPSPRP